MAEACKLEPTTALNTLIQLSKKLATIERELNKFVVGQKDYSHALVTALATKENVALISPPGTAKSYMVRLLSEMIDGARFYKTLLNPYITYDELFGPLDIRRLTEGEAVRRWSNLVKSDIVFLDEGFKANPALLNTLLSFLNERIVYDPFTGVEIKVPLISAIVASNEVPEDESLKALWDRFSVRVFGKYITSVPELRKALEARWFHPPTPRKIMTIDEVRCLNTAIEQALRDTGVRKALAENMGLVAPIEDMITWLIVAPIADAMEAGNVTISNRTLIEKMPKLWLADTLLYIADGYLPSIAMAKALIDVVKWQAEDEADVENKENLAKSFLGQTYDIVSAYDELLRVLKMAYAMLRAGTINKRVIDDVVSIAQKILAKINNLPEAEPATASNTAEAAIIMQLKRDAKVLEQIVAALRKAAEAVAA